MQEKDLRLLYEAGALSQALAIYEQTKNGFVIAFHKSNQKEGIYLETQRSGRKVAKTLDAVGEIMRRIGFKKFEVNL